MPDICSNECILTGIQQIGLAKGFSPEGPALLGTFDLGFPPILYWLVKRNKIGQRRLEDQFQFRHTSKTVSSKQVIVSALYFHYPQATEQNTI